MEPARALIEKVEVNIPPVWSKIFLPVTYYFEVNFPPDTEENLPPSKSEENKPPLIFCSFHFSIRVK